jgi:hypothetical protein
MFTIKIAFQALALLQRVKQEKKKVFSPQLGERNRTKRNKRTTDEGERDKNTSLSFYFTLITTQIVGDEIKLKAPGKIVVQAIHCNRFSDTTKASERPSEWGEASSESLESSII